MRRLFHRLPVFAAVFAAARVALAAPPPPAMSVDEIVAKNVQARGGEANLKALHSLRLTGKASFSFGDNQIEATFGQLQKRPGMLRTEFTLQGLTAVEAYDGKEGWNLQPFEGRREAQKESADEARQLAEQADIEGPLVDWKQKGHTVEYLGTEDIDGTPALKLRVDLKGGNTEYVYLDPDYFIEIHTETVNRVRGVEHVSETDLGSYEPVDGVWIPFSIEQWQKGGSGRQRYDVEHAEANVDVDDALFRFPPAGTPIVQSIQAAPNAPSPRPGHRAARSRRRARSRLRFGHDLRPRRAKHRLRRDERAGRGGRGAHGGGERRPSSSARRAAASGSRSTAARPSSRSSTGSRCSRSARSRSIRRTRRRSGSAPESRGCATPSRSATGSTSRPTTARPGGTWVFRTPSTSSADRGHPKNGAIRSTPASPESSGATAPTAASTRRPTAGRTGRSCSRGPTSRPAALA